MNYKKQHYRSDFIARLIYYLYSLQKNTKATNILNLNKQYNHKPKQAGAELCQAQNY